MAGQPDDAATKPPPSAPGATPEAEAPAQVEASIDPPASAGHAHIHPVVPFLIAGWIFGAAEGLFVGARGGRLLLVVFAAVFASILAGLLGVVAYLAALAARRIPTRSRPAASSTLLARERSLRAYAHAFAVLCLSALALVAFKLVLPLLFDLQEQDLAKQLAVVAGATMVAGSLIAVLVLRSAVEWLLRKIDQRRKLPIPAPLWLLGLLLVTAPMFAGIYPVLRGYGGMLGLARDAGNIALVACAGLQVWLLLRALAPRRVKLVSRAVAALGFAAVLAVALLSGRHAATLASAEGSPVASLGARVARYVSDVDRDGTSSLFGGVDCAPFDASRAPSRTEIPGNGVDEDCNGSDTINSVKFDAAERFSDALRKKQIKKYNIVWVIMETVRADHVSAIDYDKPTTPYLAQLAKESLLFTRAYAQSTATVLSIPSMLSGVDPGLATWKKQNNHPQLDESNILLAERLDGQGYRSAFVLDIYLKSNFLSIHRGFDDLLLAEPDAKKKNNRPRRNLLANAKAADFLARLKPSEPFFMVVYYPDQHSPYTRHKDIDSSSFDSGEIGDYDTELLFGDQQLRALVEMLRSRPALWDDTVLIVTADHGEEFGEHGGVRHALTCHNEVVHVPLLVRIPGVPAQRIDTRVGLIDIVPTILELVGNRSSADALSGQSLLVPALKPERVDPKRPLFCSVASITSKYGTFFRRAVRDGEFVLLQDVNEGRVSLYDAKKDIGEREDIAGRSELSGQVQAMKALLDGGLSGNLADHTRMALPGEPNDALVDDSAEETE